MTLLYVCPLDHLEETMARSGARHLVTLAAPGKGIERPASADDGFLSLEFHDIAEPRDDLVMARPEQIDQLIQTVRAWHLAPAIVFQCWMGISRSTASALIAALALNGGLDAQILARTLRNTAPSATPNPRMISLADETLGLGGELVTAVSAIGRGSDAFLGTPFHLDLPAIATPSSANTATA
ncbi:tyrosine phosphatase family protein [Pseudahrensia aquimaris]|uniref:Tyrosine phosphatase family protein n=1 Tax=Pseudahrensia aquimaris TaxID=744461 RepID=A0ABW3FFL7_9HYPH